MLFSATVPKWVKKLVKQYLNEPENIDLVGEGQTGKMADSITALAVQVGLWAGGGRALTVVVFGAWVAGLPGGGSGGLFSCVWGEGAIGWRRQDVIGGRECRGATFTLQEGGMRWSPLAGLPFHAPPPFSTLVPAFHPCRCPLTLAAPCWSTC
jgi:hypothetical protein